ncbi:MAG: AraC family transcriptional regulator [Planctomycetota bacterium]
MSLAHQFIRSCLTARLDVIESRHATFEPGWDQSLERINASRLIVLCDGRLPYEVNGVSHTLTAGQAILVPTKSHRRWVVPDDRACTLAWFRFHASPPELALTTALVAQVRDVPLEVSAIDRMVGLQHGGVANQLRLDAEAKAVLTRVLVHASPLAEVHDAGPRTRGDRSVARVTTFLNEHFHEPEALNHAMQQTDLSVSHFRKVFREQLGLSPQAFLTRRRMQAARIMLRDDMLSIKQVAANTGYLDPLYFSRQYRRFWGHPPSRDHLRRWSVED